MSNHRLICCDMLTSKIPAPQQDQALGVEFLLYCCCCGHYEPWDVDEDEPEVTDTDGNPPREDRS
ncbi:hypothetical protein OHB26_24760 [Nocardia sp. NBC_01503]|uniref:hypothetical protein n=1 Tax=Nocardia sp. NBC_01503 TaxID=2975997 RepID=UPI002E7B131D|nr:hypothetical protein [Nocardia sp. NBC_01503]WTL30152.1 hypothetical protein OHB26_24760 [Nocardia sp. NBC_01503]